VVMPPETTIGELATVPGVALGVMSSGIGDVPAEQTYLDISQGNRVEDSLYDGPLPPLQSFFFRVRHWDGIVRRADSAPAEIVPGLLSSTLLAARIQFEAAPAAESASLVAARRDGSVARAACCGASVIFAGVGIVRKLERGLRGGDLLIVLAEPAEDEAVPIGIAGRGFEGDLTSDSTRTDGYVLSTDVAPTILQRFGLPIPGEMDGEPIRSDGTVDPAAVEDLAGRLEAIPERRAPVVILSLVAWIAAAAIAALTGRGPRRAARAWLALAFAYMPLFVLAGAAIEPSGPVEGLLVGFGAAALAALTLWLVRGWWALAIACATTVTAYGIDVIAGSALTKLSLLGPNPIFGVRFYGIGNELEALLAVMVPVAVGAGLSAYGGSGKRVTRSAAIGAFLAAAAFASVVFGAGRLGADVGAAIVLPVGGAVASASLLRANLEAVAPPGNQDPSKLTTGRRRRQVAALIASPLVALALIALIDLVSGGNSHLTRSVLDAGGAGDLADVAQRRFELSAHDFAQAATNPLFWFVIAGVGLAGSQWRRIDAWLRPAAFMRAGLTGACVAVAVGVLVNDSGATFLTLGALALGAALAFAWARAPGTNP
jgi:hypothetical protein